MRSLSTPSKDDLLALRPGDVRLYLSSRGWTSRPFGAEGQGLLFRNPAFPDVDLLLPIQQGLGDYVARMGDLMIGLATIEDRPVREILNDLSGPPSDVLRLRVAGAVAEMGNLPLDGAIKLLEGARRLLWSSAFSLVRPEPLLAQRKNKQVDEFLRNCRLGQTERGSFVATVLAPVPPELQPPATDLFGGPFEPGQPFARQVTTRLMTSLGLMSRAMRDEEGGRLLDEVEKGVNANLCEALIAMRPLGDESSLKLGITWSAARPQRLAEVPRTVAFPQEHFEIIEELGRQFRTRATAAPEHYRGSILSVKKAQKPLLPEVAGWMVMATDVRGAPARIKVELLAEDFAMACDALRDARSVAVKGTVHRDVKGREYVLSGPSDFRVEGG